MNKKAKTMLILSCIFVTLTAFLFLIDSYMSITTYMVLFGSNPENLGEALGLVFGFIALFAYTILLGIGVLIFGSITLPFVISLMKINGKKWYTLVILIFTIVAMASAIAYVCMLPIVSDIQEAAKQANSSSNPSSASALLLL